jgi:hypothetical protein
MAVILLSAPSYGQDYELHANGDPVPLEKLASERYIVKFREPKEGERPIIQKGDREKIFFAMFHLGSIQQGRTSDSLKQN